MGDQHSFVSGGLIPAPITVTVRDFAPDGDVYFISRPRRNDETFDEWAKRCVRRVRMNPEASDG